MRMRVLSAVVLAGAVTACAPIVAAWPGAGDGGGTTTTKHETTQPHYTTTTKPHHTTTTVKPTPNTQGATTNPQGTPISDMPSIHP